jgi:regulatory protein
MAEKPVKARPVTAGYLERAAVHYLERYPSTEANLRRVLARKARRRLGPDGEPPPDLDTILDETVAKAVRSGLIDDRSFADATIGSLMRRGTSSRMVRTKLAQKGVPREIATETLAGHEPDDLALARRYAERKRLGPFRPNPDERSRERDLAALCRAGFSYRIAATVLKADSD